MSKAVSFLCFATLLSAILVVCLPICNQPVLALSADAGDCDATSCTLPEKRFVYADDNWSFSVPGDEWASARSPSPEFKELLVKPDKSALIVFLKEETTDTFAQYVVGIIHSFTGEAGSVTSIKQVMLNDNKFVEVQVNNDTGSVWVWIAVKNGYGYNFACGTGIEADAGPTPHDLCQNIADTVMIK